jgi:hypothetical protein
MFVLRETAWELRQVRERGHGVGMCPLQDYGEIMLKRRQPPKGRRPPVDQPKLAVGRFAAAKKPYNSRYLAARNAMVA